MVDWPSVVILRVLDPLNNAVSAATVMVSGADGGDLSIGGGIGGAGTEPLPPVLLHPTANITRVIKQTQMLLMNFFMIVSFNCLKNSSHFIYPSRMQFLC